MRRSRFAALTLALAASGGRARAASPAPTPIVATWGTIVVAQGPLWVAYETGAFKARGLDVNLQYQAAGLAVTSLISGGVQVASLGGMEVASADAGGADLLVLGTLSPVIPYILMVGPQIQSPSQLRGQKIAVSRFGDASDIGVRIVLRHAGIDPSEVSFVQVGSSANRVAALLSGAIQATVAIPPTDSQLEQHGMHPLFDLAKYKIPTPDLAVAVSRSWANAHHDVVQAYIDGLVDGLQRMRRDHKTAVDVLMKYFQFDDRPAMEHAVDYYLSELMLPGAPHATVAQFAPSLAELAKTNPNVKGFDVAKIIDDSYMRAAAARLHLR